MRNELTTQEWIAGILFILSFIIIVAETIYIQYLRDNNLLDKITADKFAERIHDLEEENSELVKKVHRLMRRLSKSIANQMNLTRELDEIKTFRRKNYDMITGDLRSAEERLRDSLSNSKEHKINIFDYLITDREKEAFDEWRNTRKRKEVNEEDSIKPIKKRDINIIRNNNISIEDSIPELKNPFKEDIIESDNIKSVVGRDNHLADTISNNKEIIDMSIMDDHLPTDDPIFPDKWVVKDDGSDKFEKILYFIEGITKERYPRDNESYHGISSDNKAMCFAWNENSEEILAQLGYFTFQVSQVLELIDKYISKHNINMLTENETKSNQKH